MNVQESLPIFKSLAEITKFMEGEFYILSSSVWIALCEIEKVLAPHPDDSPSVATLRAAMFSDHSRKRVTLQQSLQNPLHVLMHLLDHRYVAVNAFIILMHLPQLFA
jgi:hypothetical protein